MGQKLRSPYTLTLLGPCPGMSTLEKAVISLVELFHHYKELSRADFKVGVTEVTLDKNYDGQVYFREFCMLVGILAKGYYLMKTGGSLERP
uniref:S100 calcium binding protein W n=1 Tax=Paramormyrops kingsleyae TaxID=1676925 RepID=A0A3B3SWU1_9TELE